MRHILFEIPLPFGDAKLPIFGFGVMLLVSFYGGLKLAEWRGKKEGIAADTLWDLALWVFGFGLLGARLTSMIVEPVPGDFWHQCLQFFKIWEGGMVIFGGIPGGLLGYAIAYYRIVKPLKLRTLQLADIVAPSLALGVAFGRLGCLLNGCCYGDVADPSQVPQWRTLQFPANSPVHSVLVAEGWQTGYGFVLAEADRPPQQRAEDLRTVQFVEPGSAAQQAGLLPGDIITAVGTTAVNSNTQLRIALRHWPRNEPLALTVQRTENGQSIEKQFRYEPPRSLPVQPTQVYSSINGFLLVLILLAYTPFRRREGAVMALLMILKGTTRFLLEYIRLDNPPTFTGFTVSQNIGAILVLGGILLMLWVQTRPAPTPQAKEPEKSS
jgi:phosphatidylglycerol:prolipoprotein diacylglycerol transferase